MKKTAGKWQQTITRIALILFFMLVFSGEHHVEGENAWDIKKIEERIFTDSEYKEVLEAFENEKETIQSDNPSLYFYLSGVNYLVQNDFHEAYLSFEEALASSYEAGQSEMEFAALKQLVMLSDFYADSGKLIEYGARLIDLAEDEDDAEMKMYAYNVIALSFYYVANDEKVVEYLEHMFSLAREEDNLAYEAIYQTMMGQILYSYQDIESAIELYEEAERVLQMTEENDAGDLKLFNRASHLLAKSNLTEQEPEALLKEMEQLIIKTEGQYNNTVKLWVLYLMKGQMEEHFHFYDAAVTSFEKSKELTQKIKHIEDTINPLRHVSVLLARAYYNNGDFQEAADLYISVAEMDEDPANLMKVDEDASKIRSFTERGLTDEISSLTTLQEAQDRVVLQQRIMLGTFVLGIFLLSRAFILKRKEHLKVNELKDKLYVQSITDSLTGLYNRKQIFKILNTKKQDCTVALIDIDNFKTINDTLGYLAGDEVIKRVVQTIRQSVPESDDIGRYGGEEFLIIFSDKTFNEALAIIEEIRKNTEALAWEVEGMHTTISAGVSPKGEATAEEVFSKVDKLVHEAKRTGKNKIVFK